MDFNFLIIFERFFNFDAFEVFIVLMEIQTFELFLINMNFLNKITK